MTSSIDYHGQELRGRSFAGEHLDGANFTEADLRGADFTNATLIGADFTDARLGVRPLTGVFILLGALAISIVAGLIVGYFAETTREQAASSDWRDIFAAVLLSSVAVLFFGLIFLKGVSTALRVFVIAIVVIILVDFTIVFIMAGEIRFRNAIPLIAILVLIVPAAIAGILGRMVGGTFGAWAIAIVAVAGGLAAGRAHGGFSAVIVSVFLVALSKRALRGDSRDGPLRYLGHRFATHRGTSFSGADVSRANFMGTNVIHSDLSSAVLDGAIWEPGQAPYVHKT